jgi:hypothetical protein
MNFNIEPRKISTRDWLNAISNLVAMIDLMSRFAVDAQGLSIPKEAAREMILDLDLETLQAEQLRFLALMESAQMNVKR